MRDDWDQVETMIRDDLEGRGAGRQGECPRSEDLAQLVEGRLGRKARARTMEHVANCADCARVVHSLLRLSGEVDKLTQVADADRGRSSRPFHARESIAMLMERRWLAYTALAMAFGLAVVSFFLLRHPEQPAIRGMDRAEIKLVSPKSGEAIESPDITFRWEAVNKASRYVVDLFGASLEKIESSEATSSLFYVLPADVGRKLVAGGNYFWRVTAIMEDGQETVSKLSEFLVSKKRD
jgi:hypothetical protein